MKTALSRLAQTVVMSALAGTCALALAQGGGAAASSVGRPTISGAQGGLGVQAGLPQGGLGTQGNDGAQLRLKARPRDPQGEPFPQGEPSLIAEARSAATVAPATPTNIEGDVTAKEKRATAKRVTRSAKGQVPVAP